MGKRKAKGRAERLLSEERRWRWSSDRQRMSGLDSGDSRGGDWWDRDELRETELWWPLQEGDGCEVVARASDGRQIVEGLAGWPLVAAVRGGQRPTVITPQSWTIAGAAEEVEFTEWWERKSRWMLSLEMPTGRGRRDGDQDRQGRCRDEPREPEAAGFEGTVGGGEARVEEVSTWLTGAGRRSTGTGTERVRAQGYAARYSRMLALTGCIRHAAVVAMAAASGAADWERDQHEWVHIGAECSTRPLPARIANRARTKETS